jgi:poly(3-hydroxybutyrate) depolymerase
VGGATGSGGAAGTGGSSTGGNRTDASTAPADAGGISDSSRPARDGGPVRSNGCGKTPTLWNPATGTAVRAEWPPAGSYNRITITSAGQSRLYVVQAPSNYDKNQPYRLIVGYHWFTGSAMQVVDCHTEGIDCFTTQSPFFGLWRIANGSAIFVAPDGLNPGSGQGWSNTNHQDETFTDDFLKQVEDDLCIDTSHVEMEGFSFGGAMVETLACSRPGVFSAAVTHSAGGLARPATCQPIPYFASLGVAEGSADAGPGQTRTADFFAMTNGCTIQPWPAPGPNTHMCFDYMGCTAGNPVRWCPFGKQSATQDHTPSPRDGQAPTWMPAEVWKFMTQF